VGKWTVRCRRIVHLSSSLAGREAPGHRRPDEFKRQSRAGGDAPEQRRARVVEARVAEDIALAAQHARRRRPR
jgi:hypothetical protein